MLQLSELTVFGCDTHYSVTLEGHVRFTKISFSPNPPDKDLLIYDLFHQSYKTAVGCWSIVGINYD